MSASDPGDSRNELRRDLRRRIKLTWFGLFTYILIFGNALRFLWGLPYAIMAAAMIINLGIITVLVLEIRKSYRKL